ncbi:MAG: hypothetical protein HUK19_07250, partial [Fibrobacter sp.]|nr:hypothetical protein [Fibrobacter sp.]
DFNGKIATSNFTLQKDWAYQTINLPTILDDRVGSLSCVTLIAWEVTDDDGADVWIDDLELLGADRNSIWKTQPWNK